MGHLGYALNLVENSLDLCWTVIKYHSCCLLLTEQKTAISFKRSTSDLFCLKAAYTRLVGFNTQHSPLYCHVAYYVAMLTSETFADNFQFKTIQTRAVNFLNPNFEVCFAKKYFCSEHSCQAYVSRKSGDVFNMDQFSICVLLNWKMC